LLFYAAEKKGKSIEERQKHIKEKLEKNKLEMGR
jgi:hypothetical protein